MFPTHYNSERRKRKEEPAGIYAGSGKKRRRMPAGIHRLFIIQTRLHGQRVRQLQAGVVLGQEAHGPLAAEGHQQAIPEILQNGGAGAQHKVLRRAGAVGDEPQMVLGQAGHIQVHAVLGLHAVLEHIE